MALEVEIPFDKKISSSLHAHTFSWVFYCTTWAHEDHWEEKESDHLSARLLGLLMEMTKNRKFDAAGFWHREIMSPVDIQYSSHA